MAIAEGYLPGSNPPAGRALESHETACILNASEREANVSITVFFADREPIGLFEVTIPARRTAHVRFDELSEPQPIPRETDYSSVLESDVPIVVQHTRLDARSGELALLSTLAYREPS